MDIGVEIVGPREVELKFDNLTKTMHDRLFGKIEELTARLAGLVRGAAPGSISAEIGEEVFDTWNGIMGRVGVTGDFAKAGALEYSAAHKRFFVKAHQARLDHAWGKKLNSPTTVFIEKYSKERDNFEGLRFLRGPLASMEPQVLSGLREAVNEGIEAAP